LAGCCEHGNEPASIKYWELRDQPSSDWFLKDSAPWNVVIQLVCWFVGWTSHAGYISQFRHVVCPVISFVL
jgi:hypothetical protein